MPRICPYTKYILPRMATLAWIIIGSLTLLLIIRFVATLFFRIRIVPHTETPQKFDIPFEEVRFPTLNNRSLYGWWIPAKENPKTAPTLILVHGWSRNLGRLLRYIEHLYPLNYNLLAFDARHHGSSDKDGFSSMLKFGQDIQSAVEFVSQKQMKGKIGLIGLSIGGAGSIYASAQDTRIDAVVTVGAPAHAKDVMQFEFAKKHIPNFPVAWLLLKYIEHKIGMPYDDFAPVYNISKSRAKFLIIHGTVDTVVPLSQAERLIKAAQPGNAEFWKIEGKAHSNCHHEPGFWERLDTFFSTHLK